VRRRKKSNPFTLFSFQDIITSVMGIILLSALILAVELTQRTITSADTVVEVAVESVESAIAAAQQDIDELEEQLKLLTGNAQRVAETIAPDLPRRTSAAAQQANRLRAETLNLVAAAAVRRKEHDRLQAIRFDRREDVQRLEAAELKIEKAEDELDSIRTNKRLLFRAASGTSKRPWVVDFAAAKILVGPLPPPLGPSPPPRQFADTADALAYLKTLSPQRDYFLVLVRPTGAGYCDQVIDALRERGFDLGFDLIAGDAVIFAETPSP